MESLENYFQCDLYGVIGVNGIVDEEIAWAGVEDISLTISAQNVGTGRKRAEASIYDIYS